MPAFLPASLQVVRYCTALHVDTGALIVGRDSFEIRSGFVRELLRKPQYIAIYPCWQPYECLYAYGMRELLYSRLGQLDNVID